MKILFALPFLLVAFCGVHGQSTPLPWRSKKAAVVITYDDAIVQHLDNALPVLDALGLKATFYLTANNAQLRIRGWQKAARNGHELGNHTLFHPCIGGPGREWLRPEYDLKNYTVARMVEEIRMTNGFLEALDTKKRRTFAYTCGDMKVNDSSFIELLQNDLVAARGATKRLRTIDKVDLSNIDCYVVNGETAAQMKEWVREAVASRSLLVILFHGVGGGNGLDVSLDAHREILTYLKQNEKDIWVAPMLEVVDYIKASRVKRK